jgi:hypothetical protein
VGSCRDATLWVPNWHRYATTVDWYIGIDVSEAFAAYNFSSHSHSSTLKMEQMLIISYQTARRYITVGLIVDI